MTPRVLTVAALVLSAALAGCIADEAPEGVEPQSAGGEVPETPRELPDNRTGEFNAFQETNRTETGVGGDTHDHDYWKGRDRVDFLKTTSILTYYIYDQVSVRRLRLDPGNLVYEGTSNVELLLSNPRADPDAPAPHPAPPAANLAYRHAATKEWIDLGPVTWDKVLVIPVKPEETDMPHSGYSLWEFLITSDVKSFSTWFDVTATAVRGGDVPPWPGHPDFYAESHERLIFDGTAKTKEPGVRSLITEEPYEFNQQAPNRLISYGTKAVHVWANTTKVTAPPGATFAKWELWYHNASGLWRTVEPLTLPTDPANPKDLAFAIPVDDNGMDSPYAAESRWEFFLRGYMETPSNPTGRSIGFFGFVEYEVEYTMRVVATDVPLPEGAK